MISEPAGFRDGRLLPEQAVVCVSQVELSRQDGLNSSPAMPHVADDVAPAHQAAQRPVPRGLERETSMPLQAVSREVVPTDHTYKRVSTRGFCVCPVKATQQQVNRLSSHTSTAPLATKHTILLCVDREAASILADIILMVPGHTKQCLLDRISKGTSCVIREGHFDLEMRTAVVVLQVSAADVLRHKVSFKGARSQRQLAQQSLGRSEKSKGMVLPFRPLNMAFSHMYYSVDLPSVSLLML